MRNRPVVFVEHNLAGDASLSGNRRNRWYQAASVSSATKPLVMTDSGFKYLQGNQSEGFDVAYRRIIELSLRETPLVAIEAWQERVGIQSSLRVYGKVTNIGSLVLGYENTATLNIIVFEPTKVANVNHSVRKVVSAEIDPDLAPGATYEFDIAVEELGRANMSKVQAIVVVDYKPGGEHNGYVAANSALASKDAPPPPTDEPVPTDVPTEVPTDVPTEAPTDVPTDVPTLAPTDVPTAVVSDTPPPSGGTSIYLPVAKRRS